MGRVGGEPTRGYPDRVGGEPTRGYPDSAGAREQP
jgi:hypothetical protein